MRNKGKNRKSSGKKSTPVTYQGEIRLKIETAKDHIEISRFCEILKETGNLRIISYNWSEKEGFIIYVFLNEPVHLHDILQSIPLVEKVDDDKKFLSIVLNTALLESSTSALEISGEGALAS